MANRLAKSYVLRITPKQGEPFTYATQCAGKWAAG